MVADTEAYRTGPLREDEVERYRKDWFLLADKVMSDSTIEKLRAALDRLAGAPVPDGTASFDLVKRDERTKDYELGYITFLWKTQPEFREVAFSPYLARMAAHTDEEAGIEVGTPVGGPNFPTVWPPAEDWPETAPMALDSAIAAAY